MANTRLFSILALVTLQVLPAVNTEAAERSRSGLLALYDFSSSEGPVIKDRAGKGRPLDLTIADAKAVRRSPGELTIVGNTIIASRKPPARVIRAIKKSGEITLEAWIRPAKTNQKGPARIITLSKNGSERNVTLGQEGDKYDVRMRTTSTTGNGLPSTATRSKSLTNKLTHVVYTRERSGRARVFLNGKPLADRVVKGNTGNWADSFRLALGNEFSRDRTWLGTYHLVALYSRELSPEEVRLHFKMGHKSANASEIAATPEQHPNALFFEQEIMPILSKHCLECHDSTNREGRLDLSRKDTALAGGKHGKIIVPGKSAESPMWESIDSEEMPDDRDPLSAREKDFVKKWIDAGAHWPVELIDPIAHKRDRRAARRWVRRLTVPEYVETVRASVGVDVGKEAAEILPEDLRADGFSNTAYNLTVDLKHVEAYARLAEIITEKMNLGKFADRFSKNRRFTDKDMGALITKIGKWLLRGPVEDHEIIAYRGISTTVASAGGNHEEAVGYIVQAMLQSPRFIYQVESQKGDGSAWPVGEYELASRLSYMIWGASPDKSLMDAADSGNLYDVETIEKQVARMLKDPRALKQARRFAYEWLDLGRMDNLRPNPDKFPDWTPDLADDMRKETLAFFEDIVWKQKRPLSDLLNAQVTHTTPRLAKHYALPLGDQAKDKPDDELIRVSLDNIPGRGGLLTQGSVLSIGGDNASMVTRGLFVLHDLLRSGVKDPPPGIDTTPVPSKPGQTQRDVALQRIGDSSCGGCHSKFEPLAFGLERFDGLGTYREIDEHGNPLRDDGEILFPGTEKPMPYKSSSEMMNMLAKSDLVGENITWKLVQFALGRPMGAGDGRVIADIHQKAKKKGGTYNSLMTAIATSDFIRMTRTEKEEE